MRREDERRSTLDRRRRELERTAEQAPRGARRAAPERGVAGRERRRVRTLSESLGLVAPAERLVEVERDQLRRLRLPVGDCLGEPLRGAPVQLAALVAGQRRVRDLVGQRVLEHELAAPGERRVGGLGDEGAAPEPGHEVLVHADGRRPEHAAHDRAAPQGLPLRGLEEVEARRDDPVDRVGDARLGERLGRDPAAVAPRDRAALDEHREHLLEVEGVAVRGPQDAIGHLVGDLARAEQRAQQPLGVGVGQPSERHRGDVQPARAPRRSQVEQLGARRADEQDGGVLESRAQMLEEVEQRLGSPVHVLDHEHQQPLAPEKREVRRPRLVERGSRFPTGSEAGRPAGQREAHRPAERLRDGRPLLRRHGLRDRASELRDGGLGGLVLADPGERPRHLGEGKVGDAVAVRHAASRQDTGAVEPVRELGDEAALADTCLPEDRHELRAALADDTARGEPEERELVAPADERPPGLPAADRARYLRVPGRHRLGLPLRVEQATPAVADRALASRRARARPRGSRPGPRAAGAARRRSPRRR